MDPLPVTELVAALEGRLIRGEPPDGALVEHVSTHSGRIRPGTAFFALAGTRADGHDYLDAAARHGAAALVVRADRADRAKEILASPAAGDGRVPVVAVDDPLHALQRLAGWWRVQLAARVVAVVGSIGKTVTKDALVRALGARLTVYGTPGSYNSQLGVPLAVLDCPRTASVAVIEVAVSEPDEMSRIAAFLQPDDVILTNVGTRWRYHFTDRAHQLRELLTAASALPAGGRLLLGEPAEDLVAAAGGTSGTVLLHRQSSALPGFARERQDPRSTWLDVSFPSGEAGRILVGTASEELLRDVELAISAAWMLGVEGGAILSELSEYTPTATRREIWRSPSGVTLVREVATPDPISLASAVRAARSLTRLSGRTVVVVAPSAGGRADEAARRVRETLVDEGADEMLTVEPGSSAGADGRAPPGRGPGGIPPVHSFDTVDDLRRHLVESLRFGDVCLVQSPPGSGIGELARSLVEAMAPTRLYIDLSAMEENVATFRRLVGPCVRLMAMVKALAYGTDALALSLSLHVSGVDWLGVAGADEGIDLRRAGVDLPILVMMGNDDEIEKMIRYRLTPMLYSPAMVAAACRYAEERGATGGTEPFAVHVEIDTGMHRAGLDWTAAPSSLRELAQRPGLWVEGLMTHLASADDPAKDGQTRLQLQRFDEVVAAARELGHDPIVHAAATAGAIRFPAARYDMVRIGLGLFGLQPSEATAASIQLAPAVSLVSRLVQVKHVPEGEGVGYGATWTAPVGGARIGVVPFGYFDCMPRASSNVGYVMIDGVRCPIVGTISMDSMTIDLAGCPDTTVGTDVLVFGQSGLSDVPVEEVARAVGTIPYELMARVGPRVQRILTRH